MRASNCASAAWRSRPQQVDEPAQLVQLVAGRPVITLTPIRFV
jgi:hypothetical protein